jgi:uncharacterized membrane protein YphA (DoxX/SURF4 family)
MKRNLIVEIIACLLIILFVYAGVTKLIDYEKFEAQIGQSPMLTRWAGVLAWLVPVTEILISLLLTFGRTRLTGLYCSFGLLTMFTFYIIIATRFSDFVPCSCGGVIEYMTWSQHLIFNGSFLLMTAFSIIIDVPAKSLSRG